MGHVCWGVCPIWEDALALGRARGLRILMAETGVAAIKARYQAAAGPMLGQIGTTEAFRLWDRESRSYVKSLYGRHRAVESYRSTVQRGMVEQVMDEHVISDEDLTALQTGESIIATLHYPPFLFRLRPYGTEPRRAFLSSLLPWFDLKSAAPGTFGCRAFALCSYR